MALARIKGIYDALVGNPALPKTMRNALDKYGTQTIKQIVVKRTPLSGVASGLLNLITLGKWNEIKKAHDEIYHLYAVITLTNGKTLLLEKNERPVLSESVPKDTKETQAINVPLSSTITLADFIGKTIKQMSLPDYIAYDGFRNNCQVFIRAHLLANRLLNPSLLSFVFQDTRRMIEQTPSFSQWLGKAVTDVAGAGRQLLEEVIYKRGGLVGGRGRGRGRRFGL
jgi:hypothetical protein